MNSHESDTPAFVRPLNELLELLDTTRPDGQPVRVRIKPDRRIRREPPPGGVDRRATT